MPNGCTAAESDAANSNAGDLLSSLAGVIKSQVDAIVAHKASKFHMERMANI